MELKDVLGYLRPFLHVCVSCFWCVGLFRTVLFVLQIYIESKDLLRRECVVVLPDDRLGLFLEEAPAAVAYTFDPSVVEVLGTYIL